MSSPSATATAFHPKHTHPFTLFEATTLLDVSTLTNEISRLQNSIMHLRRTHEELKGFEADENDANERKVLEDIRKENELTVEVQEERIEMCKRALVDKLGYDPTAAGKTAQNEPVIASETAAPHDDMSTGPAASDQAEQVVELQAATAAVRGGEIEDNDAEEGVFL